MLHYVNAQYNTISWDFLRTHGLEKYTARSVPVRVFGSTVFHLFRVPSIKIGPYRIDDPVFFGAEGKKTDKGMLLAYSGDIGPSVLSRFDVTFDYAHRIMYLKPNAIFHRRELSTFDGMSLFMPAKGQIRVTYIAPHSPAADAGLRIGDQIVAIEATPVRRLGLSDVFSMETTRKYLDVTFKRHGVTYMRTISLTEMLP